MNVIDGQAGLVRYYSLIFYSLTINNILNIIILLILAGISIASLTGNGLFEKAKLAKEKQDNAQIEEDEKLGDYENRIETLGGGRQDEYNGTVLGIKETKGNGTQSNPYIITDAEQLKVISILDSTDNLYIKLGNDIDLSEICYKVDGTTTNDKSWKPICSNIKTFNGNFNGDGHTIKNLYINTTEGEQGLFSCIGENGVISNLIINGTINAGYSSAGFASTNNGTITNCVNNATITVSSGYEAAGIVARNYGKIYRCRNTSNISSLGECAGGISGCNGIYSKIGFIVECINNGNISSNSWVAGGITASNGELGTTSKGFIYNCYNTGDVTGGNNRRSGIVGQVKHNGGISYTYNCYNRGNIYGCPDIVGFDWGGSGSYINENSHGVSTATIDNLNTQSNVDQLLMDSGLYRTGVWVIKNGQIALDWE